MKNSKKRREREKTLSLDNVEAKTAEQIEGTKSSALEGFTLRNIEALSKRGLEPLTFTFEDFDRDHIYFNLSKVNAPWFILLLDILKELSKSTWTDILKNPFYDAHPHDWNKTTAMFPKDKCEQYEGVQFGLGQSFGRVHGYVIGNLFYIVWLDKYHNLYDISGFESLRSKLKRLKQPGISCLGVINEGIAFLNNECDSLKLEITSLKSKNKEIKDEYDTLLNEHENTLRNLTELTEKLNDKKKKQDKYNKKFKKKK